MQLRQSLLCLPAGLSRVVAIGSLSDVNGVLEGPT